MENAANTTDGLDTFHLADNGQITLEKKPVIFINLILTLYWICIVLILAGNLAVIVIVIKYKALHTVTNMYIVSLCLSDIAVAIFTIPADILSIYNETFMSDAMCKGLEYVAYVALCSNIYSVLCISVDRFRATVKPFFGKKSKRQALMFIAMVWGFSCVYGIRAVFWFRMERTTHYHSGTWISEAHCVILPTPGIFPIMQRFIIVDFFLVYIFPLSAMTILHVIILKKVYKSENNITSSADKTDHSAKRKTKMIRMLILITIIFALCQFPENLYMIVRYIYGDFQGSFIVKHICDFILFTNSWLNVVAYVLFNDNFRKVLLKWHRKNTVGTMILKESKTLYNEETRTRKATSHLNCNSSHAREGTSTDYQNKTEPGIFIVTSETITTSQNR